MVNEDQIKGEWKKIKGDMQEQWGKLTDDDIAKINGKKSQLLGKLQTRYGYTKEQAEKEYENFEETWSQLHPEE